MLNATTHRVSAADGRDTSSTRIITANRAVFRRCGHVDRALGDAMIAAMPSTRFAARTNRAFLGRAVCYLAAASTS
jgi:class 3 adenylate cyclase